MDCVESVYDVIVDESLDVLGPHEVHVVEVDVVHQCQALQIANFLSCLNHHLHNSGKESLAAGLPSTMFAPHNERQNSFLLKSIFAHD